MIVLGAIAGVLILWAGIMLCVCIVQWWSVR